MMDERQMQISMGQAINIASELILKNEFKEARNKEFSAKELAAQLKAAVPHIYLEIISLQESLANAKEAVKTIPEKKEPEFELD